MVVAVTPGQTVSENVKTMQQLAQLEARREELIANGYEYLGRFSGEIPGRTHIRDNLDGTYSHTWLQLEEAEYERFSDIQAVPACDNGYIWDCRIDVYAKRRLGDPTKNTLEIALRQLRRGTFAMELKLVAEANTLDKLYAALGIISPVKDEEMGEKTSEYIKSCIEGYRRTRTHEALIKITATHGIRAKVDALV